jgi:imidazolonepropionase-like amidohydrolase
MSSNTKKIFVNFKLFDGIKDGLQENKIILVKNERIEKIEESSALEGYQDYEIIDLDGQTLLPGLIDAHIHITVPFIFETNRDALFQMKRQLELNFLNCIKFGVTTVRDVGAFPKKINTWRKKINRKKVIGPRILTSTSFITSEGGVPEVAPTLNFIEAIIAGGQFVERIESPEEAVKVGNRLIDRGADWLKTQYSEESFVFHGPLKNLSDDTFMALRKLSRDRGIRMAMHHTETSGFNKGIQIGVDTLEHCATTPLKSEDVEKFIADDMAIVPTIKVFGDSFEIEKMLSWLENEGKADFMPEPRRQSIQGVKILLQEPYPPQDYMDKFYPDVSFFKKAYPIVIQNVEKIKTSGGKIGIGTDTCGTGLSFFGFYWKELKHLTQAGFSNYEALKAATSVNAEIIGMEKDVGSIASGKYADFILLSGNPLKNIEDVKNVNAVFKGGEKVL